MCIRTLTLYFIAMNRQDTCIEYKQTSIRFFLCIPHDIRKSIGLESVGYVRSKKFSFIRKFARVYGLPCQHMKTQSVVGSSPHSSEFERTVLLTLRLASSSWFDSALDSDFFMEI